jgi:hypothetical protein
MTTAMLFFLLKKKLDFYATMCHVCKNEEKIIRAFGSGHIERYRQPAQNPTNHR